MCKLAVVLALSICFTAETSAQKSVKLNPKTEVALAGALRAEAAKVDIKKYSKLFADLADAKVTQTLELSDEQLGLARCLGELSGDIIRAWMLRDLDAPSLPSKEVLNDRLGKSGDNFRAHLAAYAEAFALEGVLDSDQSRRWRGTNGRRADAPLVGSAGPQPITAIDQETPTHLIVSLLRHDARSYQRTGGIFGIVLGYPSQQSVVTLSGEQAGLVHRLDELSASIIRLWFMRGLAGQTMPRWSVLADRASRGRQIGHSLRAAQRRSPPTAF